MEGAPKPQNTENPGALTKEELDMLLGNNEDAPLPENFDPSSLQEQMNSGAIKTDEIERSEDTPEEEPGPETQERETTVDDLAKMESYDEREERRRREAESQETNNPGELTPEELNALWGNNEETPSQETKEQETDTQEPETQKSLNDLNLNVVSVEEDYGSRVNLAKIKAEDKFNQERANASLGQKIFKYGIGRSLVLNKLKKEALKENTETSSLNVGRFEKALENDIIDILDKDEQESITVINQENSDGRRDKVVSALKQLASETAAGNSEDAYKAFKEQVEAWQQSGTLNARDTVDARRGYSADNLLDKGEKVIEVAQNLQKYNTSMKDLQNYIDKNVTLNTGMAKVGPNSIKKFDRMTEAMMTGGVLGAAGMFIGDRVLRTVTFGAGGAILGGANSRARATADISKADINIALGRENTEGILTNNKDGKKGSKFQRLWKLTGLAEKRHVYDYDDAVETERAQDVTEAMRSVMATDEHGKLITDEEGRIRWAEGISDEDKEEFARDIGALRAKLEIGSKFNIDLVTYDVAKDENLDELAAQKARLTMALADSMLLLRTSGLEDKVAAKQQAEVKKLEVGIAKINQDRNVYKGAMALKGVVVGGAIGAAVGWLKDYIHIGGNSNLTENTDASTPEVATTATGDGSLTAEAASASTGGEDIVGPYEADEITAAPLINTTFVKNGDSYELMTDMDSNGYFEHAENLEGFNNITFDSNGNLTEESQNIFQNAGFELAKTSEIPGSETVTAKTTDFSEWLSGQKVESLASHENGGLVEMQRGSWNNEYDVGFSSARLDTDHENIVIDVYSKSGNTNVDDLELALTGPEGSNVAWSYDIENGQVLIPRNSEAASMFEMSEDGVNMIQKGRLMEVYGVNDNGSAEIYRSAINDNSAFDSVTTYTTQEHTISQYTFLNDAGQKIEIEAPVSAYTEQGEMSQMGEYYLDHGFNQTSGELIQTEEISTLGDGTVIHETINTGGMNSELNGFFMDNKNSDHAMGAYLWENGKVDASNIDQVDAGKMAEDLFSGGPGSPEGTVVLSKFTGNNPFINNVSDTNRVLSMIRQDNEGLDNYTNETWNNFRTSLADGGYSPKAEMATGNIKGTVYGYIGEDGQVVVSVETKTGSFNQAILSFDREIDTDGDGVMDTTSNYFRDQIGDDEIREYLGWDDNVEIGYVGAGANCSGHSFQINIYGEREIPTSPPTGDTTTPDTIITTGDDEITERIIEDTIDEDTGTTEEIINNTVIPTGTTPTGTTETIIPNNPVTPPNTPPDTPPSDIIPPDEGLDAKNAAAALANGGDETVTIRDNGELGNGARENTTFSYGTNAYSDGTVATNNAAGGSNGRTIGEMIQDSDQGVADRVKRTQEELDEIQSNAQQAAAADATQQVAEDSQVAMDGTTGTTYTETDEERAAWFNNRNR